MIAYMTSSAAGARRAAAVIAARGAAGRSRARPPTRSCRVTDPDIINPGDVQSAAGANAVRLGALARFNSATSGGESLFLLGGLFADEWNNGDSFIARQEIDQRVITIQNNFLTDANRALHRARLSASRRSSCSRSSTRTGPAAELAEMYFVQAYVENIIAEHYCNGIIFSTSSTARRSTASRSRWPQTLERALAHADSGLALITGTTAADVRVRNALRVIKGRILAEPEPARRCGDCRERRADELRVSERCTAHDDADAQPDVDVQQLARRYSVSTGEGTNGLNFATANDPRVPIVPGRRRGLPHASASRSRRATI